MRLEGFQKGRILALYHLLSEYSDENHPLSITQLSDTLTVQGYHAERKGLYRDLAVLKQFGVDIRSRKGNRAGWFLATRTFTSTELSLLADAVRGAPFLTPEKTEQLLKKLSLLASRYQRCVLRRFSPALQYKTSSEEPFSNLEQLYTALASRRAVMFQCSPPVPPQLSFMDGPCAVSPLDLVWDANGYVLIAYHHILRRKFCFPVAQIRELTLTNLPCVYPTEPEVSFAPPEQNSSFPWTNLAHKDAHPAYIENTKP